MILHRLPVGSRQIEFHFRRNDRIQPLIVELCDLLGKHVPRCQRVRLPILIGHRGEYQRITGTVMQNTTAADFGYECAVKVAGVHVDKLVVRKIVLYIKDKDSVGDIGATIHRGIEESINRYAFTP